MTSPFPRSRHAAGATALGALLLLVSACGSSSSSTGTDAVASLGTDDHGSEADPSAEDTPALEAPDDPEDAFALYNECMADAGFGFGGSSVVYGPGTDAIDVTELDESAGPAEVDPQQAAGVDDFDPEAFEEANAQCNGHLAAIDTGFDLSPEEQAAFDDAQLEFTDCMEEQGIEMPEIATSTEGGITLKEDDPDPEGGAVSFGDFDFDFEAFQEAAKSCRHKFDEFEAESGPTGE
ncbi:MAG: hypothetical protein GY929_01875 [Actinomycetia bacterium]|nr:hypothetical protein [Actinomycetes bacterium]